MKVLRWHTRRWAGLRMLRVALVMVLLAGPAQAAANFAADCECCPCCSTTSETENARPGHGGCCDRHDPMPCHMAAQDLPNAPLARVQTSTQPPKPPAQLPCCARLSFAVHSVTRCTVARVAADPAYPPPDINAQTCRLIC